MCVCAQCTLKNEEEIMLLMKNFKTWKGVMHAVFFWLVCPLVVAALWSLLTGQTISDDAKRFVIAWTAMVTAYIFYVMHRVGEIIDEYEAGSTMNPVTRLFLWSGFGSVGLIVLVGAGVMMLSLEGILQPYLRGG